MAHSNLPRYRPLRSVDKKTSEGKMMTPKASLNFGLVWISTMIATQPFAHAVATQPIPAEVGKKVVARYVEIVQANYTDALHSVRELRKAIDELVKSPTPG